MKKKNVVVIGGGTGIFNVLSGLKSYPLNLTSIVTTFDNGGSTGILRDEFGMLPSGDMRRSLVALAPETGDLTIRNLFNFRFEKKSSLRGHSFGNLFLNALTAICGSEVNAIKKAGQILNIAGRVLPVSTDKSDLCAILEDGTKIIGETNIDIPKHDGNLRIKKLSLTKPATIYKESYKALLDADLIIIGPGDLYTSILPNVLVSGFKTAIAKSKAKVVYITNIVTKWGETNGFRASDFASTLLSYMKKKEFDCIICNSEQINPKLARDYAKEKAFPVTLDLENLKKYSKKVLLRNIIHQSDIARHDPRKLAKVVLTLV
jgi:uncharacterized cofD-like protein